jgi:ATP phosphoribosyltransferase
VSDGALVLAVPSKGRLQENASAFFARAGLVLSQGRGAREYRGAVAGVPDVEVLFLSASEIVAKLAAAAPISASPARTSSARASPTRPSGSSS